MRIKPGIYRHFRGEKYRVIRTAIHSETLEEYVVYEALYHNPTGKYWVRPLSMFTGTVVHEGNKVPRFAFVGKGDGHEKR